jgi:hypothetical protein
VTAVQRHRWHIVKGIKANRAFILVNSAGYAAKPVDLRRRLVSIIVVLILVLVIDGLILEKQQVVNIRVDARGSLVVGLFDVRLEPTVQDGRRGTKELCHDVWEC